MLEKNKRIPEVHGRTKSEDISRKVKTEQLSFKI